MTSGTFDFQTAICPGTNPGTGPGTQSGTSENTQGKCTGRKSTLDEFPPKSPNLQNSHINLGKHTGHCSGTYCHWQGTVQTHLPQTKYQVFNESP